MNNNPFFRERITQLGIKEDTFRKLDNIPRVAAEFVAKKNHVQRNLSLYKIGT
jgi:hypothetical protein